MGTRLMHNQHSEGVFGTSKCHTCLAKLASKIYYIVAPEDGRMSSDPETSALCGKMVPVSRGTMQDAEPGVDERKSPLKVSLEALSEPAVSIILCLCHFGGMTKEAFVAPLYLQQSISK